MVGDIHRTLLYGGIFGACVHACAWVQRFSLFGRSTHGDTENPPLTYHLQHHRIPRRLEERERQAPPAL